jgi:thiamine-phosphate pyrophosphorylase
MPSVDFSLYLVTDRHETAGRPLKPLLVEALAAGVRAVQIREKDLGTRDLLALTREVQALIGSTGGHLLINDRVDIALASGADGVHLRADSLPVLVARRLLGSNRLIGVSTHSAEDVVYAEKDGADFVVLGPIYETTSKLRYGKPIGLAALAEATRRARIPIFAIGGVTASRVAELKAAGAAGVAVISAVLAADAVGFATRTLIDALCTPI